jgi:hypothetical protein
VAEGQGRREAVQLELQLELRPRFPVAGLSGTQPRGMVIASSAWDSESDVFQGMFVVAPVKEWV